MSKSKKQTVIAIMVFITGISVLFSMFYDDYITPSPISYTESKEASQ